MTVLALAAFLALISVALFGERIAPYEPIYFVVEHGDAPRPYEPGLVFPFGSDVLGRDLLSLVLAGARATLTIVLLAGLARVVAGVLVAAVGNWWRPARLLTETVAELAAAVPATLVALVLVKAFVKTDASVTVLIGALLLVGWAGPYRVIRAEVNRLGRAPFTLGAMAVGVGRWRLLWRHHLPHLAPVVAMNLTQQVVASLVLLAELGVLGVLVGAVRAIDVEESQTAVRIGPPMSALVPDTPEWGAMLASSRTVEILWATRWVIFVPGAAFALTAVAVATIGYALARRYARRDFLRDRGPAVAIAVSLAVLLVVSGLIPPRYAEAREWAAAARDELEAARGDASAFAGPGLSTYPATREISTIVRSGPASVTIGSATVAEGDPSPVDPTHSRIQVRSLVRAGTGGGVVEAPLVFAARGIVPAEQPPLGLYFQKRAPTRGVPDIGALITDYPDDYAGIDVHGKVVLLVRFLGVGTTGGAYVDGPPLQDAILSAIDRGAAAVLFVDPQLSASTYLRQEREFPAVAVSGTPVVVLDQAAAQRLVAPLGLDLWPFLRYDAPGTTWERSAARDLGVSARVEVPLRAETTTFTSLVTEVAGVADDGRVVVWVARDPETNALDTARKEVVAGLARVAAARRAPFVFVDFDPRADSKAVAEALRQRRILLVLVLEDLRREVLRFRTANGDLIPALDHYAREAGARHDVTRRTESIAVIPAPFPGVKTIVIGTAGGAGDARADTAAVIGYLAGRFVLGAPELPR